MRNRDTKTAGVWGKTAGLWGKTARIMRLNMDIKQQRPKITNLAITQCVQQQWPILCAANRGEYRVTLTGNKG